MILKLISVIGDQGFSGKIALKLISLMSLIL